METNLLERLYGVFIKPQTYLNLVYLLLAFPLGLAYFIFLVTGFSLGIGLLILWIGLLILVGVIALCWPLTLFERQLAIGLLHVEIPSVDRPAPAPASMFQQFKNHLSNPVTWKGIAFLLLKFPIGVVSFVVTVTLLSLSLGLVLAPLGYPFMRIDLGGWEIQSMPAAAIACLIGLVVAPLSLHALNYLAQGLGAFARFMLGNPAPQPVPPAPVAPAPVSQNEMGNL